VLAGLSYALGSAMVARMWAGHLSFLEANAWLPLATGLALEMSTRRRMVLLALTRLRLRPTRHVRGCRLSGA